MVICLDEHIFLEKLTHAFHAKRSKVEVLFYKVLYTFSLNFFFSRSKFTSYNHALHCVSYCIK